MDKTIMEEMDEINVQTIKLAKLIGIEVEDTEAPDCTYGIYMREMTQE